MRNRPQLPVNTKQKKVKRQKSIRKFLIFWRRIRKFLFILVFLGIFIYGAYFLVHKTDYFLIKEIQIEGATTFVNSTDLRNLISTNELGQNIIFVDTKDMSNQIKNIFLGVDEVEVEKKFPSTLYIKVKERIPLALLKNESAPDYFMVDREGYLLGKVSPDYENLPKINYSGDLKVGKFINQDLIPLYQEILGMLEETKIKSSSMSFQKDYVSFFTLEGIKVLVDDTKDVRKSFLTLSKLLQILSLENKAPKFIDLRYDKVVVSY